MKNKLIIGMIMILLITSCSAPSKVKTPKGDRRVSVNNPVDLAAFEVIIDDDNDQYRTDSAHQDELKSTITDLKQQISELRQQMKRNMTTTKATSTTKNNSIQAPILAPNSVSTLPKKSSIQTDKDWIDNRGETQTISIKKNNKLAKLLKDPKNRVTVRDENVIFTVNFASGKKNFNISKEIKSALLELAKASENIEVRGYTDSDQDSQTDNDTALARAVAAYDFLVMNGIPPNHIYVSYESSGNFIADNATLEGRALNRRVEIEIIGTDVSYFY